MAAKILPTMAMRAMVPIRANPQPKSGKINGVPCPEEDTAKNKPKEINIVKKTTATNPAAAPLYTRQFFGSSSSQGGSILAVEAFEFVLQGDDFQAIGHLACVFSDLGDFFSEDGAIGALHLKAALAELTGDETGGVGDLKRSAAVVATDGERFHAARLAGGLKIFKGGSKTHHIF